MKRLFFVVHCIMILLLLVACDCKHEWKDATCDAPKTCVRCEQTEGEALGHVYDDSAPDCENPKLCGRCSQPDGVAMPHTWLEASCTAPKTCGLCGTTEGVPMGHSWIAATCDMPKTCEHCGLTDGEAQGHSWQEATCVLPKICAACYTTEGEALGHKWDEATTEKPKTCRVCRTTDGDKLNVDSRFKTDACKFLFGKWKVWITEAIEFEGTTYTIEYWAYYEFGNDGTAWMHIGFEDRDQNLAVYEEMLAAGIYAQFAQMGMSKTQADAEFQATLGTSIQEYCKQYAQEIFVLMEEPQKLVYYVMVEKLFIAESWKSEFIGTGFEIVGNKLHLDNGDILIPVE